MKREFKAGELVFHEDYFNDDLNGFGRILEDVVLEDANDLTVVEVNNSGENETTADRIYKIAEKRICPRCGCVLLHEFHETRDAYTYVCPDCDENFFAIEARRVSDSEWSKCLTDSIGRFMTDEIW